MRVALERVVGVGDVTGEILGFQKGGDWSGAWEKGTRGRSEEPRPLCQSRHCLLVSATPERGLLASRGRGSEGVSNLPGRLGTARKRPSQNRNQLS